MSLHYISIIQIFIILITYYFLKQKNFLSNFLPDTLLKVFVKPIILHYGHHRNVMMNGLHLLITLTGIQLGYILITTKNLLIILLISNLTNPNPLKLKHFLTNYLPNTFIIKSIPKHFITQIAFIAILLIHHYTGAPVLTPYYLTILFQTQLLIS